MIFYCPKSLQKVNRRSKWKEKNIFLFLTTNRKPRFLSVEIANRSIFGQTTMITKLDKLCKSNPQTYRCRHTGYSMLCEGRQILDKEYICSDKTLLSFKPKKRASVPLTEEQKEERRERLREIHERRKIRE